MAGGPVPRPDSHDTVPAHPRRQHQEGVGQPVPRVRLGGRPGRGRPGRRGGAGPPRGVPEAEGEGDRGVLPRPQGRVRRGGPREHRGADVPADGRQEDRRLRQVLRHGHPVRLRRHPRAQDIQPHGPGEHEDAGGDGVRAHGDHPGGEVVRHQQVPGPPRPGGVPAEPPALRPLPRVAVLRPRRRGEARAPRGEAGMCQI